MSRPRPTTPRPRMSRPKSSSKGRQPLRTLRSCKIPAKDHSNSHNSNSASPHVKSATHDSPAWEAVIRGDAGGVEAHGWASTDVLQHIWSKFWPLALFAASMTN